MSRLPTSGTAFATPLKSKAALKDVLAEIKVGEAFNARAVDDLYSKIGLIIGKWLSEQSRAEGSTVAKLLLSAAHNLSEISTLLGGHETGLRSNIEMAVTSEATKYLALDPTVGSQPKARDFVSEFQQDARRMAHVCLIAGTALHDQTGSRGRPALDWYAEFTALLLEIAATGRVKSTLRKDRITEARGGWLFEAAWALEPFLYSEMRSPSAEACGKRLERSRKALRKASRQK
jgi:hypothetical protein